MQTRKAPSAPREIRTIRGIEIRDAAKESGFIGTLAGYAAMFNCDSVDFGGWIERIAPGAFGRTLREMPDVAALWAHTTEAVVARAPKTLRLAEDDKGLRVEMDLVDTTTNRDLLANVRAGNVDSMSFGFVPVSVRWDAGKDDTPDIRTLLDLDLYEVSAVLWPAYPDTTLGERSHQQFRETRKASPALRSLSLRNGEPEPVAAAESEANSLSNAERGRRLRILTLAPSLT